MLLARPHVTYASVCSPGADAYWEGEIGVLWTRTGNHDRLLISASFLMVWSWSYESRLWSAIARYIIRRCGDCTHDSLPYSAVGVLVIGAAE